jgi:hypothetical protein
MHRVGCLILLCFQKWHEKADRGLHEGPGGRFWRNLRQKRRNFGQTKFRRNWNFSGAVLVKIAGVFRREP